MAKKKMKILDWVAISLLIVGGINWGLVGFTNYNLVTSILGSGFLERIVYSLVGISALYSIWSLIKIRK